MITTFVDFIISSALLYALFFIGKDILKTLIISYFEEKENESCNLYCNTNEKKSRRYRYDEEILREDDF